MEKLRVKEKCIGCGICATENSKYFEIGDDGFSKVIKEDVDAEDKKELLNIIESCPADAIVIEEEK